MGHLLVLGRLHGVDPVSDGGPLRLPAHPPTPLGRVQFQILQGRGIPLRPLLLRADLGPGGGVDRININNVLYIYNLPITTTIYILIISPHLLTLLNIKIIGYVCL